MASPEKVKHYIACWFQLGKRLVFDQGKTIQMEESVIKSDRYSSEFENFWQEILDREGANCYLEGTDTTVEDLLSPTWDITACARCTMPIPRLELGIQPLNCPCFDMPNWPNFELPLPRIPVQNNIRLSSISDRLKSKNTIK